MVESASTNRARRVEEAAGRRGGRALVLLRPPRRRLLTPGWCRACRSGGRRWPRCPPRSSWSSTNVSRPTSGECSSSTPPATGCLGRAADRRIDGEGAAGGAAGAGRLHGRLPDHLRRQPPGGVTLRLLLPAAGEPSPDPSPSESVIPPSPPASGPQPVDVELQGAPATQHGRLVAGPAAQLPRP